MRPTPAASIAGTTRLVTRNAPRMLMSKTRSHSAMVRSRKSTGELTPATFARPMTGGRLASTWAMAASTESGSATSAATPSDTTDRSPAISPAVRFAASPSRSRMAIDQPSRASRSAVARPMPRGEAAPVMTAVRSAGNGLSASMAALPSDRGQATVILPRIGRSGQRRAEITPPHSPGHGVGRSALPRSVPAGRDTTPWGRRVGVGHGIEARPRLVRTHDIGLIDDPPAPERAVPAGQESRPRSASSGSRPVAWRRSAQPAHPVPSQAGPRP